MQKRSSHILFLLALLTLSRIAIAQCGNSGFTISSPNCVNQAITFTDTGTIAADSVLWRFDNDNTTATTTTTVKTYTSAQTDTVWLYRYFNTPSVCVDTVFQVITITNVTATISPTGTLNICAGDTTTLTANAGAGLSYQWIKDGASLGGETNQTLQVTTAGTYRVQVTQNGCSRLSDTVVVNVYNYPAADFNFATDSACSGSTVSFANASTGSSLSYQWNFGNGSTSTATNPTTTYDVTGTATVVSYTARLIATTPGNCGDTITKTVYVRRRPNAAISDFNNLPPFVQCNVSSSPFSLQVDNTSTTTGTNNSYSINWGDGNSQNFGSSFDTITHVYGTTGSFTITLLTTDNAGCTDTTTYTVFNGGNPGVSIGNSGSTSGCTPYALTFTIDTSKATGIGNNAPGSVYTLTFNDGTAPMVFSHPPPPSVIKTFLTPSCGTATTGFPNSFQAEMSVTNPCGTNSATVRPIYISTKPEAEIDFFPNGDTACRDEIITIIDDSDTGSVSSNSGCNETPRRLWNIFPATGWTLTSGYFGNHSNWNNNPANWGSGTLQVDFDDTGTYTIQLIVGNIAQAGVSVCGDDTITRVLRIFRPPLAGFTLNMNPVNGCTNTIITTTNTSTGDNLTYQWSINPNSGYTITSGSLTSANPSFQFNTAGTYIVTLIGSNQCDQDTVVDTVVIRDRPVVTLPGTIEYCGPDTVNFDTLASNLLHRVIYNANFGDTLEYEWTVSGGGYTYTSADSTVYNPSIFLSTPGTYTIQVRFSNECGDDTATQTVIIHPFPDANFTVNDTGQCINGNNFVFTDASTISTGAITTYTWTFGDGTGSAVQSPAKSYATTDTFDVQLLVESGFGCLDSITRQVIVFPQPTPVFSINDTDQCLNGNSFVFTNSSTISSGTNSFYWTFSNRPGDTSTQQNPTFAYDTAGTFAVKLVVTSDNGCADSVTANVYVRPKPEPDFTVNDSMQCLNGNSFEFTNATTISSGTVTYKWVFSTAADTSVSNNPTKVYASADTFEVRLIATSNFGCADSVSHPVYVFPKPDMAFTVNDSQQCFTGNSFVFTNGSSISSGTVNYKWQFSNDVADTSILANPTKNYAATGVFPVKLVGTSDQGCMDSATATMTVYDEPQAGFDINDTAQCLNGNSFTFADTSVVSGPYTRTWTFGDGGSATTANPTHSYATADTFEVKLVVTIGAGGCRDSVTRSVYVFPKPDPGFTVDDSVQCFPGHMFSFTNGTSITSGTVTYLWKFDAPSETDTSTQTNPVKSYAAAGTYIVRLTATSDQNCKDSIQKTVVANPPLTDNTIASNQGVCAGDVPDSLVQTGPGVTGGDSSYVYQWQESSDSALWTNIVGANGVNYQPPALNSDRWFRRIVVSGPCTDTSAPVKVTVTPAITANIVSANQTICEGFAPAQLQGLSASGGLGTYTYQWQQSTDSVTWGNIGGAQDTVYQPGTLNQTLFYRRLATSGVCTNRSNVVKVLVNPKPAVSFTTAGVCLGLTASFTSTSTIASGSIAQYNWNYGDGNTGTGSSQTHGYNDTGFYTIKLITVSDSGCSDSTTRTIHVHPKPVAVYTFNDTCLGFGHSFNATGSSVSAGTITDYAWNFADATTGNGATIAKTYAAHGSYSVKLIVTTDSACRDSITQAVVVHPRPVPAFAVNDTDQCVNGNDFEFTNTTTIASGSSTYLWNLGESATDTTTQTDADKTYAANGDYDVKLIATSNFGCVDSVSRTVYVYSKPTPAFTINDTDQCLNGNQFIHTNSSTVNPVVGLSYLWTFGDGTSSTQTHPTMSYVTADTFAVKLVVTSVNGCVDSLEKTVYVYPKPDPGFTINDTLQCFAGNQFIYTNNSAISSGTQTFFWKLNLLDATDTSTQTNVTKTYTTSGNLVVRLTATSDFGCKDSIQKNITVRPDITNNNIGLSQNVCSGSIPDTVQHTGVAINGGDGSFTYQWQQSTDSLNWTDIGGATLDKYGSPALFTTTWFRLVAVSGPCSDTSAPVKITVTPGIGNNIISAGQSHCAGFTPAQFTGTVPTGGNGVYVYQWQISTDSAVWSDISGAQDTNFQAGVLNQTTWYRRLATSNSCTVISIPVKVNINPKPAASFTAPSVCFGLNANFNSTSTITIGAIVQYNWTFGDGDSATGTPSPQHAYGAVGNYTAKLIITSDSGCMDSTTRVIYIHPKPVAAFVYNDTCHTFANSFDATGSTVSSGAITGFSWDFGDGSSGSGNTTNKTYAVPDSFDVKLVVTTDSACRDSITQTVAVHPNPVAGFTVNDSDQCVNGNNFEFTNTTTIATGSTAYNWTFGEGATDTSTLTDPTKTYAANGSYNVRLLATSALGCTDSNTQTMVVYAKPAQAFNINDTDQCLNGNSFTFTNSSTINPVVGLSYLWDFGNGDTSTQTSPSKIYSVEGTYPVKLVVTSVNDCKDSITKNVYVYPKPDPGFTVNDSLQCFGPNSFTFTNNSAINGGTLIYFWRFDLLTANDTSTQTSPSKTYGTDGTYTIRLTATSNNNCKDSIEKQVTVKPDILNNDITAPQSICAGSQPDTLRGSIVSGGDSTYSYLWLESTDSSTWSQLAGIITGHYYPPVLLTTTWYRRVVLSGPCADTSAPIKITVTPGISNNSISASQAICEGFAPTLFNGTTPTGGSSAFGYQWQISADSASWSNIGGATDSSYQSGALTLTRFFRRAVTSGSCTVLSTPIKVTVHPKPAAVFTTASVCFGFDAEFNSSSSVSAGTITQTEWQFDDGNTDTGLSVTHNYAAAGAYTAKLIVTTTEGCQDSSTRNLWIHPKPVAAFVHNDTCFSFLNSFNAATTTVATGSITGYDWTLGDGATATGITTSRTYAAVGSYNVKLIVTTDSACLDSTNQTVVVHPNPVAEFAVNDSDQCVNGNNFVFTNGSSISAGTITHGWTFGEPGTDTSSQQDPSKTYSANGNYTVRLITTSGFGCRDSITQPVVVYAKPAQAFSINDSDQCVNGNSFTFTNNSTISPVVGLSYVWSFGNGDTSTQTSPTKVYDTAGTYPVKLVVTSLNDCKDSITKNVYVYPKPTPGFTINDTLQCFGPNAFALTNTSTVSSGTLSHFWRFDLLTANDTLSQTSPVKTYTGDGTFTIRLINTSDRGCKDSIEKQVTVKPDIVNNAISAPQFICEGSTPDTLRQTSGSVSGGDSTFAYQWQQSTDSANWTNIGGATATLYGPPALTVTTWYRRIITSGPCADTSVPVKVHVTPAITNNVVSSSQQICYAQTPAQLTSTTPGGGSGVFGYLWQQSADTATWSSAAGTNTAQAYQPGSLLDTIYYRRRIISGACTTISNVLKIAVKPLPVIDWDATTVCYPNATSFSDSSTVNQGSNTAWWWTFGDGGSSTQQHPSKVYTAGTYTVRLVVTTNFGCRDSLDKQVTIHPKPQAGFTAPDNCFDFNSIYTDTSEVSTGSVVSWAWAFGDGITSAAQNPTHHYNAHGTYNVRQIVTTDMGCRDTLTKPIVIHPKPQANYGASTQCFAVATQFTDSSNVATGNITLRQWNFGDGDSATLTNPTHTYTADGIYFSSLIVTTDRGCKDSAFRPVTVHPLPVVTVNSDTLECVNKTVFFSNTTTGAATYHWDYGDGDTSNGSVGSNSFPAAGTYHIVLVARSAFGCEDSSATDIRIITPPTAAFTVLPDTGCAPLQVNFTNSSTGEYTTYDWNFGNGTSSILYSPPTATYQQSFAGDSLYIITLRATNICATITHTDTVRVFPKPVAAFTPSATSGCSPQVFNFTNTSTAFPDSYYWEFGNGDTSTQQNPAPRTYTTTGGEITYNVKLTVVNHCGFDTVSHTITIYPKPDADFTVANGCLGLASNFTDGSAVASGSIAGWNWAFGDGNTSLGQNPSRTYATFGTYNARLIVTTNRGCLDTVIKPVTIHPKPVANFGAASVCENDSTPFTDSSSIAAGSITSRTWTFGDGNTSTLINPSHLYAGDGSYVTKLVTVSDMGCSDSISRTVTVHPLPVIAFTGDTLECANRTVFYNNNSTGAASYVWNYGDGDSSTGISGSNSFPATGYYRVVLTGTSVFGCIDSTAQTVRITEIPSPAFTLLPDTGCAPLQVNFVNNSIGEFATYDWTFGDGTSSTQFTPAPVTYQQSNTADSLYIITLKGTNLCGNRTVSDTVRVFPQPVSAFTPSITTGCSPQTVAFTNSSSAFPDSYYWDFGNGDTSTQQNPGPRTFTTSGAEVTYTVRLTVQNHCGFDTVSHNITIYPKPDADFATADNCFGLASTFTDAATVASGSITNWSWAFGDGNTSLSQSPNRTYAAAGTYNVRQIVSTNRGCRDTVIKPITIFPKPVANFGANAVCEFDSTQFTDSSSVTSGNITGYNWTFGDGNTSTFTNPANLYPGDGSYVSQLIITTNNGCSDSITRTVTVHPLPVIAFTGDTLECINRTVLYTNNSTGATSYTWNYGDGGTSTGSTGSHTFSAPGFYRVVLVGRSVFGCEDSTAMVVHITDRPVPAFTLLPDTGCAPLQVNFVNNTAGLYTRYDWNFGNGTSDTAHTPAPVTYQQSNTADSLYIISLRATNLCGNRSVTDTVRVFPRPRAAFSINIPAGCSPQAFTFTNQSTAFPDSYQWDFGNGDTSTQQNPGSRTFTTSGGLATYTIKLTVINHCGFDTVSHNITVYPKPDAAFTAPNNCEGLASAFTSNATVGSGSILSWAWAFGDGNTANSQNPTRTYASHGTYNVRQIVTSDRGCSDTITQAITIYPKPVARFVATSVCVNDSTQFTDSSTVVSGNITNRQWIFGDGNTSTLTHPANLYPGDGSYVSKLIITTNNGCQDSTTRQVTVHPLPVVAFSGDTLECINRNVTYTNNSTGASTYTWNYGDGNTSTGVSGSNTFAAPGFYRVVLVGRSVFGCEDSTAMIVHIIDRPTPALTLLPDTGCAPLQVNFVNNTTGLYATYNWNLGNGTSSTLTTPPPTTYQQSNTGDSLYFITLRATNMCGFRSVTDTITVFPKPVAAFSPDITAGCSPQAFTFTSQSTAFPETYYWEFGDGDTSTQPTPPPHIYTSTSGITVYNIRLRVSNHCGFDTVSHNITVYPKPVAGFDAPDNCFGFTSSFTDTAGVSAGSIVSRAWAFGDGNTATSLNPNHNYAVHGTYNVRQIVTTDRGCRDTVIKPIVIHPKPDAAFGVSTACFGDSTRFTDSSTVATGAITGWDWTFGNGNTSALNHPRNLYPADGVYVSKLVITTDMGCRDSITKPVTVRPLPVVAFNGDTLECINRNVFYTNATTGASSYTWNYGDGDTSNGSVGNNIFTTPGYYRVVLVGRTVYGCEDSAAQTVHIIGPPTPAFTVLPDSGCAPLQVNFVNNSTGDYTTYDWNFGNGGTSTLFNPPPVTYPQSLFADTAYYITLRATNICATRTAIDTVEVYPKPLANFGTDITSGCTPITVNFTNTSTAFPEDYYWDFGDGDTSTQQTPPAQVFVTDSVIRTYNVRLRVVNRCGTDTVTRQVTVLPKNARSLFGADTLIGCVPLTVNFTDFSLGATIVNYDFDDGNTSNLRNPSHTFTQPGTYRVRQFIANTCTYDTSERTITVLPGPPVALSWIPSTQCQGQDIQFQSIANNISGFRWEFGNGDTSVLSNPAYKYPAAGTYTVRLVVTSAINSCTNSALDTITINAPPVPVLVADSTQGCPGHTVNFSDGGVGTAFITWRFGDGNSSNLINPSHTYTTTGVYIARMIVRDARGCEDSIDRTIQIHPVPVAGFTQTSTYCNAPVTVNFTNTSTGATAYSWDFDNTLTSSITDPSVQYSNFGIFTPVLTATNLFGCSDTASAVFEIFRRPMPDISLDTNEGCPPVVVNFTTNSQFANSYEWDFGDGFTSTLQNPTHTYTTAGTFAVKLKVTSGGTCADSLQLGTAVTVFPVPVAGFDFTFGNSASANYGVANFIDQSQNASIYLWDLGDGTNSTEPAPTHRYNHVGNYLIMQYITTPDGCKDTAEKWLELPFFKGLFVPNAFTPGQGNLQVRQFIPVGVSLKTYSFAVYDAWGKRLFYTEELIDGQPAIGWDGFHDGAPCAQDVYVWKVEAEFLDGSIWPGQKATDGKYHREGTVTLIR